MQVVKFQLEIELKLQLMNYRLQKVENGKSTQT